jgi:hypothetical protein
VKSAFLLAENDYINYAWLPKSLFGESIRVQVMKAWYGEKQAPKLWIDKFRKILIDIGFKCCPGCPCLFLKYVDDDFIVVGIFVDDGLTASTNQDLIHQLFKDLLTKVPELTMVEPVVKYVGIEIDHKRDNSIMYVSQRTYIENDLTEVGYQVNKTSNPSDPKLKLREAKSNPANESLLPIIGKLRFVADRTRHGILASLGLVTTGGTINPSDQHVKAAQRIVDFLRSTSDTSLKLGGSDPIRQFGMCDASLLYPKSRIGGAIWLGLNCGAVYSFSKTASTTALNICHAELQALIALIKAVLFVKTILDFLGHSSIEPVKIYLDNTAAIQLSTMLKDNIKNSPLTRGIQFIRESINRRIVQLIFIRSHLNVADLLTKGVNDNVFAQHEYKLQYGFDGLDIDEYIGSDSTYFSLTDEEKEEEIGDIWCFYSHFNDIMSSEEFELHYNRE